MRIPESHHDQLKTLTLTVARDAWRQLKELKANGHKFETLLTPVFREGMTSTYKTIDFTYSLEKGAIERLREVFGRVPGFRSKILYSDLTGALEYDSFMEAWPAISDFLSIDSTMRVDVFELPTEIAERVMHLSNSETLDEAILESTYSELSRFWLEADLPVELVLPILGVAFEIEDLEFSDGCRIRKLSDGEQWARWPSQRRRHLDDAAIMATHALVVPGWKQSVNSWFDGMTHSEEPDWEVPAADTFFQALAMATDAPSGYAQIVTYPQGWARRYNGTMPPLRTSDFIQRFSQRLGRGQSEPAAMLDAEGLSLLSACYETLITKTGPLEIAARRLLRSEMRAENEQPDIILDLCIGLEALLSDNATDMTYKLGIRAAAVLGNQGWSQPSDYADAIKKIYDRRSAIVHGRGGPQKAARISAAGKEWTTEDLARTILRQMLLSRHSHPHLDAKAIDAELIRPAIDAFFDEAKGKDPA